MSPCSQYLGFTHDLNIETDENTLTHLANNMYDTDYEFNET